MANDNNKNTDREHGSTSWEVAPTLEAGSSRQHQLRAPAESVETSDPSDEIVYAWMQEVLATLVEDKSPLSKLPLASNEFEMRPIRKNRAEGGDAPPEPPPLSPALMLPKPPHELASQAIGFLRWFAGKNLTYTAIGTIIFSTGMGLTTRPQKNDSRQKIIGGALVVVGTVMIFGSLFTYVLKKEATPASIEQATPSLNERMALTHQRRMQDWRQRVQQIELDAHQAAQAVGRELGVSGNTTTLWEDYQKIFDIPSEIIPGNKKKSFKSEDQQVRKLLNRFEGRASFDPVSQFLKGSNNPLIKNLAPTIVETFGRIDQQREFLKTCRSDESFWKTFFERDETKNHTWVIFHESDYENIERLMRLKSPFVEWKDVAGILIVDIVRKMKENVEELKDIKLEDALELLEISNEEIWPAHKDLLVSMAATVHQNALSGILEDKLADVKLFSALVNWCRTGDTTEEKPVRKAMEEFFIKVFRVSDKDIIPSLLGYIHEALVGCDANLSVGLRILNERVDTYIEQVAKTKNEGRNLTEAFIRQAEAYHDAEDPPVEMESYIASNPFWANLVLTECADLIPIKQKEADDDVSQANKDAEEAPDDNYEVTQARRIEALQAAVPENVKNAVVLSVTEKLVAANMLNLLNGPHTLVFHPVQMIRIPETKAGSIRASSAYQKSARAVQAIEIGTYQLEIKQSHEDIYFVQGAKMPDHLFSVTRKEINSLLNDASRKALAEQESLMIGQTFTAKFDKQGKLILVKGGINKEKGLQKDIGTKPGGVGPR